MFGRAEVVPEGRVGRGRGLIEIDVGEGCGELLREI